MYENLISHRDLYFLRFWDYRDLGIKKQNYKRCKNDLYLISKSYFRIKKQDYKKQDSILLNKEIQDKLIYVERYLAFH